MKHSSWHVPRTGCGAALIAQNSAGGSANTGLLIENLAGGSLILGANSSAEVFSVDNNGKVSATGGFSGQCLSSGTFNTSAGNACNLDFAEAYASSEPTEAGDLAVLVPGAKATVRRSKGPYDALLAGVVSTNPGLVLDNGQTHLAGDNSQLITKDKSVVALVGRVPVKISMENGPPHVGDPITSSSKPGVAMRATEAGKIVGYALEPAEKNGTVLVIVQPGYYAAPEIAALRTRKWKQDQHAQSQDRQMQTIKRQNAELRQQLQMVLAWLTQISNKVEIPSVERDQAARDSASRASALIWDGMARKSPARQ